jgi:hypothetical protein
MELLIKRLLDSGLVALHDNPNGGAALMGVRADPSLLVATDKGREYFSSLGLETQDWAESDA